MPANELPVRLDGRTLEGGGQLVRVAVSLSAITRQPVSIHHIRGNREVPKSKVDDGKAKGGTDDHEKRKGKGKSGLKASHAVAISFLAEVSDCSVSGGEVSSQSLTFTPAAAKDAVNDHVRQRYAIHLPTAGSVFLVFQAVYPYLLTITMRMGIPIELSLKGGTNNTFSPSYDYVTQVLLPNFRLLGVPRTSVRLTKRGWSTGPTDMGEVKVCIYPPDPVQNAGNNDARVHNTIFPSIDLSQYERGKITSIDLTILAPDYPVGDDMALRRYMEQETSRVLRGRLQELPSTMFQLDTTSTVAQNVPVNVHTSERTTHNSRLYVLIVAHTTSGFRVARDALLGEGGTGSGESRRQRRKDKTEDSMPTTARGLIELCVQRFTELSDPRFEESSDSRRPCVDAHCRDQVVMFEALGGKASPPSTEVHSQGENERYWSLHTRTAIWVCEQLLGRLE